MTARYNLDKYYTSVRWMENFLPELHGPATRRMGTYFLEDLGEPSVLVPFQFSSDPSQNFVLIFQENKIRVANQDGFVLMPDSDVPVEISTDYKYEDLYELSYTQAADVMYIAHINYPPKKLIRNSNTEWVIEDIQFVSQVQSPSSVTVAYSGSETGTYTLRYKVVAIDETGRYSDATTGSLFNTISPSAWPTGATATISWTRVSGATSYKIFRESAGAYGYIGLVEDTGSDTLSYVDVKYTPDFTDTPREFKNPFTDGNFPAVVTFFQQRLVFGGPKNEPQKIYMSRTGLYEDFSKSDPLQDDDMIEVQLASGRQDAVKWVSSFGNLIVGTSGNEYRFTSTSGAISATDINAREQSAWGSAAIPALIVGREILHVQRQGSYVRTLSYSLDADGYDGTDLSILASELFGYQHYIKQWIYRQYPDSSIMCIRSDGIVLSLVYHKEHSIYGWAQFTTDGKFMSIATISGEVQDDVYFVVEREVNGENKYYLEYLEPLWEFEFTDIRHAHFVDCGLSYFSEGEENQIQQVKGLEHLEGKEVVALVNGSPHGSRLVVRDGSIDLDYPANDIIIGLPYNSYIQLQNPEFASEVQTTLGRPRTYSGSTTVRLFDSVGGWYYWQKNPDRARPVKEITKSFGNPVQPATEDYQINFDTDITTMPDIWLMQIQPLPLSIAGIRLDVEIH